ncbi:MAG: hypothetical protein E6J91_12900 [Deltaproteobacteria bacterium]|nr:MAG: hypothetical protein E6J91_12900 [Deltaproteobacteria bacterium]
MQPLFRIGYAIQPREMTAGIHVAQDCHVIEAVRRDRLRKVEDRRIHDAMSARGEQSRERPRRDQVTELVERTQRDGRHGSRTLTPGAATTKHRDGAGAIWYISGCWRFRRAYRGIRMSVRYIPLFRGALDVKLPTVLPAITQYNAICNRERWDARPAAEGAWA